MESTVLFSWEGTIFLYMFYGSFSSGDSKPHPYKHSLSTPALSLNSVLTIQIDKESNY
jgi:hypothetical protein